MGLILWKCQKKTKLPCTHMPFSSSECTKTRFWPGLRPGPHWGSLVGRGIPPPHSPLRRRFRRLDLRASSALIDLFVVYLGWVLRPLLFLQNKHWWYWCHTADTCNLCCYWKESRNCSWLCCGLQTLLDRCFTDIEQFVMRIQQAADAYKELDNRRSVRVNRHSKYSGGRLSFSTHFFVMS